MLPSVTFLSITKQRRLFILITGTLLVLLLAMQIINNRFWMHDFEVYYLAARAFLKGGPVYGQAYIFDTAFYKYSPFSLFLFAPFSILPFGIAKVVFFLLVSVAAITTIVISALLLQVTMKYSYAYGNGVLFIVLGIVSSQVFRELHLGNVNMILLLMMLIILWLLLKGKHISAGILFALVLFIKPHFLILAPLLLIRKQYRSLAVTFLTLIAGLILPATVSGYSGNLALHKAWIQTMQNHNESLKQAYDNIYSLFFQLLTILHISNTHISEQAVMYTLLAIVAAAFGWFIAGNILQERKTKTPYYERCFAIEFLILIALIPNLVITDSEHFLLSIPLIIFLLGLLRNKISLWYKMLVVLAILLYAMNIHDLVGANVSLWLTHNGILGLGNLMLIGLTIYGFRKYESDGSIEP
jgi:hypothetical protein